MLKQVKGLLRLRLIDVLRSTRIYKVLNELRKQQYMPREEVDNIRKMKRDRLFQLAKSSTNSIACNSYEELSVLTKDQIRANFKGFISSRYKNKLYAKTTGGSTGAPMLYYTTAASQSYLWAGLILSWEAAGYQLGDKVAFIAGTSLIKKSFKHKAFYKLLNVDLYFASPINDRLIEVYLERIKSRKTKIIYGYANIIYSIAHYILKRGETTLPHLKAIISTSEILTQGVRQTIEKAFGVKVYNQYGCNEAGISAFECEHHNMHLISTRCIYEVNSTGNLIGTDLTNEGFIIMKYDTGDLVEFAAHEDCACKRTYPIIKKLIGRSNDLVVDMNNNVVHDSFFGLLFNQDQSVRQYQIVFDRESITIKLLVDELKEAESYYYNKYVNLIRPHVQFKQYHLKVSNSLEKGKNGKVKQIIDQRI